MSSLTAGARSLSSSIVIDRLRSVLIAGSAAMLISPGAAAAVPEYPTVELQARSNIVDGFNLPPGSSFSSGSPALADDATVTFRLIVAGDTGNAGLWYGQGAAGDVVYDAPVNRLLSDPSINAAGQVVFERNLDFTSEGLYLYDPEDGSTSQVVPTGGPFGIDSFADPGLNDAGAIGFRADLAAAQAYIVDDGGVQTQLALEGSDGVGFLFVPRFNDVGQLAGKVRLGGTSGSLPDEIRRYEPGGGFTTIAVDDDGDPGSPYVGFDNGVGISDNGWVAFVASLDSGGGVFLSDGVTTRTIATSADPEIDSIDFFRPVVNDDGVVAFRAFDSSGLRAVFAGDGTELRRIVTEHDLVPTDLGEGRIDQHDSSPVFGGSVDINANGDVVFSASLTPADDDQVEWGSGVFVAHAQTSADVDGAERPGTPAVTAWPNPFDGRMRIEWTGKSSGDVRISVHDAQGRRVVETTIGGQIGGQEDAGPWIWDGRDASGRRTSPGVYFIRLADESGRVTRTRAVRVR